MQNIDINADTLLRVSLHILVGMPAHVGYPRQIMFIKEGVLSVDLTQKYCHVKHKMTWIYLFIDVIF